MDVASHARIKIAWLWGGIRTWPRAIANVNPFESPPARLFGTGLGTPNQPFLRLKLRRECAGVRFSIPCSYRLRRAGRVPGCDRSTVAGLWSRRVRRPAHISASSGPTLLTPAPPRSCLACPLSLALRAAETKAAVLRAGTAVRHVKQDLNLQRRNPHHPPLAVGIAKFSDCRDKAGQW
jgi:hypothetical protein